MHRIKIRRRRSVLLVGAVLSVPILSRADTSVFNDSFPYANGNLVGQGPWLQTSTTTTNPIQVLNGAVKVGTSGQDVYAPLTTPIADGGASGGGILMTASVNVTSAQSIGDYFWHLGEVAGGNFFDDRVYAKSVSGGFAFGLSDEGSTPTYGATLSLGTTYQVDALWNFVPGGLNDTFALYVNPTNASNAASLAANNTPYATYAWTTTFAEPAQIASVNLRQGSASAAPAVTMDNLSVYRVSNSTSITTSNWTGGLSNSWDSAGNWNPGVTPDGNTNVIFPVGPTNTAITLGTAETASSLEFDSSYSLSGSSLVLTNGGISVAASQTATINSQIAGSLINKTGGGTLLLTGSNNSSTATSIAGGTLELDSQLSTSSSGGISLSNGTIALHGGGISWSGTQALSGTGSIIFNGTADGIGPATSGTLIISPNITVATGSGGGNIVLSAVTTGGSNQGTISAATSGKTLTVAGNNWNNTGTLLASNGATLSLGGTIANLGTFLSNSGTIEINSTGTVVNTGSTLLLANPLYLNGGTINGGTLGTSGTGTLILPANDTGTLSGVTLNFNLIDNSYALNSINGLTLNGGSISIGGSAGASGIFGQNTQTIGGTGIIQFDGTGADYLSNLAAGSMTIGSNITVKTGTNGGTIAFGSGANTGVNLGTISAQTAMTTITIAGNAFTNTGTIAASNGGIVAMLTAPANVSSGVLTGGHWYAYDASSISIASTNITTNAADILLDGTGSHFDAINNLATNNGTLTIADGRAFSFVGSMTNNGTLAAQSGGAFTFASPPTNFNAGVLTGGHWYASGSTLDFGASTITTNAADVLIDGATSHFDAINSLVTNNGTLTIAGGRAFSFAGSMTNNGTLAAKTAGLLTISTPPTNYSAGVLTGGHWDVYNGSTISFGASNITTNAADILLDGATSHFDAINNLATNNGTFTIANGRTFGFAGNIVNNGTLNAGSGGTITIPGGTNTGTINSLTGGTIIFNGSFVQATHSFLNASGSVIFNGGTQTLNGTVVGDIDLTLAGAVNFGPASKTTIKSLNVQTSNTIFSPGAQLTIGSSTLPGQLTFSGTAGPTIALTAGDAAAALVLGNSNVSVTSTGAIAQIVTAGSGAQDGQFDLGGQTRTISFNPNSTLLINAQVANGGLATSGAGLLEMVRSNTYAGGSTITTGTLQITDMNALGTGSVIFQDGTLDVRSDPPTFTLPNPLSAGPTRSMWLHVQGVTSGTQNTFVFNSATLGTNLTVGGTGTVQLATTTLTNNVVLENFVPLEFTGPIMGNFGITRGGSGNSTGTVTISGTGSNTFTGVTTVNRGALVLNKTGGPAVGGNVVLNGGSLILAQSNQLPDTGSVSINNNVQFTVPTGINDSLSAMYVNSGTFVLAGGSINLTNQLNAQPAVASGIQISAGGALNTVHASFNPLNTSTGSMSILVTDPGSTLNATGTDGPAIDVGGHGLKATLTAANGGKVTSANARIGDGVNGDGTILITGLGSTMTVATDMSIATAGNATISVQSGAQLTTNSFSSGLYGGSGTILISGSGSGMTVNAGDTIGFFGDPAQNPIASGQLFISNGGSFSSPTSTIGATSSSLGTVSVNGSGSRFTNSGSVYVGANGPGTLSLASGAAGQCNDLYVGNSTSVAGNLFIDGAGTGWMTTGAPRIGAGGFGTMIISNGGTFASAGTGIIADGSGAQGTVTISGGGSWTSTSIVIDGNSGSGTIAIQTNGSLIAPAITLGVAGSGLGTVLLSSGSLSTTSGGEFIGENGSGTFLQSGGTNSVTGATGIFVGRQTGSKGFYQLSNGTLSTISLFVGYNGAGTFAQTGGTVNDSGDFDITTTSGSAGTCSLNGGIFSAANAYVGGNSGGTQAPGTLSVAGGSMSITGKMQIWNQGTVLLNSGGISAGSLTLTGGGKLFVAAGANAVLKAGTVSIDTANGSKIDLNDNAMLVNYVTSTPIQSIRDLVKTGFAGGGWTGLGITSNAAALIAADPTKLHKTAIGFAEAGALGIVVSGTLIGQPVDNTTVVVRYTYSGDANLDGSVDTNDFDKLAANFGASGKFWSDGDYNYDGTVNALDFNALATNYGQMIGSPSAVPDEERVATDIPNLGITVPEPFGILPLAALFLVGGRRRRASKLRQGGSIGACWT